MPRVHRCFQGGHALCVDSSSASNGRRGHPIGHLPGESSWGEHGGWRKRARTLNWKILLRIFAHGIFCILQFTLSAETSFVLVLCMRDAQEAVEGARASSVPRSSSRERMIIFSVGRSWNLHLAARECRAPFTLEKRSWARFRCPPNPMTLQLVSLDEPVH